MKPFPLDPSPKPKPFIPPEYYEEEDLDDPDTYCNPLIWLDECEENHKLWINE